MDSDFELLQIEAQQRINQLDPIDMPWNFPFLETAN